jgi:hypothetical protein
VLLTMTCRRWLRLVDANVSMNADFSALNVCCGSLAEAHRSSPSVRCVPFSASQDTSLSVSFGENRRPEMIFQRRECAHSRLTVHESGRRGSARKGHPPIFEITVSPSPLQF